MKVLTHGTRAGFTEEECQRGKKIKRMMEEGEEQVESTAEDGNLGV